jgi:glutathionylspermidine synthase
MRIALCAESAKHEPHMACSTRVVKSIRTKSGRNYQLLKGKTKHTAFNKFGEQVRIYQTSFNKFGEQVRISDSHSFITKVLQTTNTTTMCDGKNACVVEIWMFPLLHP